MHDMQKDITNTVRKVIHTFLKESASPSVYRAITLDASLEQDLGIDSLKKAELLHRIESAFSIQLPNNSIVKANTVNDIVVAVQKAKPTQLHQSKEFVPTLDEVNFNPSSAQTLTDVLMGYSEKAPERPHLYLQDEYGNEQVITYGKLFDASVNIAHGLNEKGFTKGDTAAIMLPSSANFFYAFFGVLLAGGIPVPIYPPF